MNELQAAHDALLAHMPPGVNHDTAACSICTAREASGPASDTTLGGDIVSTGTFTQDEVDAAIAAATAPILEELNTLRSSQEEAAIDARITELEAAHAAAVADLQTAVDNAVLEASTAKTQYDELVALLESEANAAVEAAIFAAVREERIAQVEELKTFSPEHIEANADRWASQEAEAFEAQLSDWQAIVTASKGSGEGSSSFVTAMQASQEDRETASATDVKSVRAELMASSIVGVNLGTI